MSSQNGVRRGIGSPSTRKDQRVEIRNPDLPSRNGTRVHTVYFDGTTDVQRGILGPDTQLGHAVIVELEKRGNQHGPFEIQLDSGVREVTPLFDPLPQPAVRGQKASPTSRRAQPRRAWV